MTKLYPFLLLFVFATHPTHAAPKNKKIVATAKKTFRSPAYYESVSHDELLGGMKCANEVNTTLSGWKSKNIWRFTTLNADGARVFFSPTDELGEWVEMVIYPEQVARLRRLTYQTESRVVWDIDACRAEIKAATFPTPANVQSGGYFDRDLKEAVASGKPGVVYSWSPHMPLSVKGLKEVEAAAKKLNVQLIVVLDPDARDDAVATAVAKNGLPKNFLKKIASLELIQRRMTSHFPSLLVFNKGEIVSATMPGYDTTDVLVAFIKKHLE